MTENQKLLAICKTIPVGYSQVFFEKEKYGITRTDFNNGNSIKIFGQSLKSTNFISTNIYCTSNNVLIKPCEMPLSKVVDFILNFKFIKN